VFETLFGGDLSVPVRFAIAFGVVLSLIALTFVGIRRFAGRRLPLSNGGRARQPRLGVLDAFAIDARRRLVLIRRDNVEHLIMIGGPNDVLVESEIVRAPAQAALAPQQARRAPGENSRAAVAAPQGQVQQRPLPAPEQPAAIEPAEQAPLRPAAFRNVAAQRPPEPARAPAPPAPPPAAAMPPARPAAPPAPPRVQREVAVEGAEDDIAKPKAAIDPLYADIERKLGEALSRAPSAPPTAPPPPPTRAPAPPPPSFERPPSATAFERAAPAPSFSRPAAPTPPPAPARPAAPPPPLRRPEPAPAPAAKDTGRSHLDALEEEMASLLGRDRSS
jgi:flagellar protein FliO/FliZ